MNVSPQTTDKTTPIEQSDYTNYDLFILIISLLSLVVMALYYIPAVGHTETAVAFALDTVFSFIFLYDFFRSLKEAPDRLGYFKKSGWLDLLGSLPAITIFRIFRIARLVRILRTMRHIELKEVWRIYKENKAESTFYTTLLIVIMLLTFTSLTIVQIESDSPEAQITTSSDALWWSLVTTTTVGYGDLVPTTDTGRFLATLLMTLGVALVSVITSYVTSSLILRGDPEEEQRRHRLEAGIGALNERFDRLESKLDHLLSEAYRKE